MKPRRTSLNWPLMKRNASTTRAQWLLRGMRHPVGSQWDARARRKTAQRAAGRAAPDMRRHRDRP